MNIKDMFRVHFYNTQRVKCFIPKLVVFIGINTMVHIEQAIPPATEKVR